MSGTIAFERSHDILIDAAPAAVFDYVTNPHSWPEWIAASHEIDSPDRPLAAGDTFREQWMTRELVTLEWTVLECDAPRRWLARTATVFTGPILVQYTCEPQGAQTRYTRTVRNPARPKAVTPEMLARIDAEAATALANIKANVERQAGAGARAA